MFIFSGITFLCLIIIHCVVRFSKKRKIGYEVHLLMFTALTESVSVRYTLNPFCSSHPNTFCTDNIRVFVWESGKKVTSDLIPDPLTSNSSYREIATIRRQGSGQTISLALRLTKGYIVLGFLDQGGCKILSSVRITYNICPETTLHDSLVKLLETVAPSSVFESILVGGTCTVDSFHVQGS